ncbi:MAG: inositol monophosphatase family protein [Alphaproteobacteria bacterium]
MPEVIKRRITPRAQTLKKRPETREEQMIAALSPNLNVMVKAVRSVGRRMVRDFGEISSLQVSLKGPGDFVSNADMLAEKSLIKILTEDRPDYGFVTEEGGEIPAKNGCPFTWIIDPIDGTSNFLHAIPCFAVSVALRHKNEIIAGVTFNPVTNELYYAEKGQGAFLMTPTGNMRLRVAGRTELSFALVGSNGFSNPKNRRLMEKIVDKVASVRYNGCTTLSMAALAAGQLDVYIATQFKPWDLAVGFLLVKEAGGYISDFDGHKHMDEILESQSIVAGNYKLNEQVLKNIGG